MLRQQKTVQFSNLSEDHKAEFIHFLIKNNICFQEGKQNCTAKVSVKPPAKYNPQEQTNNFVKKNIEKMNSKNQKNGENKPKNPGIRGRPLKDIAINSNTKEKQYEDKDLKTPKKTTTLRTSTLSCKANSQTMQKNKKTTPRSNRPINFTRTSQQKKVSEYDSRSQQFVRTYNDPKDRLAVSRGKKNTMHENENYLASVHQPKRSEIGREKPVNKYHHLFESVDKGRAVRWPINMLERIIQQIYDQIFTRNTQCLQTKHIDNALRTLNMSSFPHSVEHYFYKKFKTNKLASTNLNNMLYSLSYHVSKDIPSLFLKTFQDFLTDKLQHEDILYYLFARNVLKKELKAVEKARQQSRHEGTYFPESIKAKDISKLLKQIIGRDNELVSEYKQIIMSEASNKQYLEAYEFLQILLEDFHERRIMNSQIEHNESTISQNIENQNQYSQHNEQLTFGEEHYQHNTNYAHNQSTRHRGLDFWECARYSRVQDSLMELILQKLAKKAHEFVEILASDINKPGMELHKLQELLVKKSECLVRAVFEMNKMQWLKELNITIPSEQDMTAIENLQIKLKKLREAPTGKDIGQFCKNILTVEQLVNELEIALTYD